MNNLKVQNSAYKSYIYTHNKDFKRANDERIKFYKEGRKNPFMAMLIDSNAQYQAINEISAKDPKKQIKIFLDVREEKIFCALMQHSKLSKSAERFNKKFNKLYPKTGEFRKDLINYHKIRLDEVTPKLGINGRQGLESLKNLVNNAANTIANSFIQRHNSLR